MEQKGVRLQKVMADAGIASRREAERMIADGLVRVNGEVVTRLGATMVPGQDRLEVAGSTVGLSRPAQREVWALYKPKRVVSTLNDPQGRPTLKDFFPKTALRLFPVGRLDYDAEGLILVTNDGDLAQRVAHPSHSVPKTYLVKVKGTVDAVALARHARAPVIDGKPRRPIKARVLHGVNDKTWVEMILKEGIHHHIKKFFDDLGYPVLKLKRFQIGSINLGDMMPGQCRKLTQAEVAELLAHTAEHPSAKKPARTKPNSLPLE